MPHGAAKPAATAGGNPEETKAIRHRTENRLNNFGDISAALRVLKIEIAKRKAR
ncbi:DUF1843 domain-containing protein [Methylogaea oryzae]|uniref:DUF1843 domain-containing protein n=1 Tax=Methylogaea oryzae TaxID=1295382 RepID=UPI0012E2F833|nr:DUF1843 domain-containing protein [Methylogaea oryzae]